MRRHRRHWRRPGWDIVRTPFGQRVVPRGEGLREAARWELWKIAVAAVEVIAAALLAMALFHSLAHK